MQRHNCFISAESRILLHLLYNHSPINQFDVPITLTQIGIAQKTDVNRGYVHRPLKNLMEMGYVQEYIGHTECGKRKCKYYILTDRGEEFTIKLKKKLLNLPIIMRLLDDTSKIM